MAKGYFCNFPILHKSHWSSIFHNLAATFGIKTYQNSPPRQLSMQVADCKKTFPKKSAP